jgi:hypothetical protein
VVEFVLEPADQHTLLGGRATRPVKRALNLAAAKLVTASSSLETADWGTNHLVNEITHSLPGTLGWSSAGHETPNQREWIGVDLGRSVWIDTARLYPRDDQAAEGGGFPVNFTIQASDDGDHWTTLATQTDYLHGQPARGVQTFTFSRRRCRYVRLEATRLGQVASNPLDYRFQLAELEVYGP